MRHQPPTPVGFLGSSPLAVELRSHLTAALGDSATWPTGLKNSLGILLNAGTPMVCWWGPERWMIYNPAYATAAHPPLAQPLTPLGGPLQAVVEGVFATGQPATLAAEQAPGLGLPATGWACSPLWNAAGQVEGVFATAQVAPTLASGPWVSDVSANGALAQGAAATGVSAHGPDPSADRQQALAAALQDSEERFCDLADNISQLAWMADASGDVFWYNQRWYDFTGTTPAQVRGWGWQTVQHPDHLERVRAKARQCFASGDGWEDTFPLRGIDGQYRWFLCRVKPVRDDQGQVLRWVGTNTDITALRQTETALAQATERLDMALKSAPITLFTQDYDLRYTWVHNPTHDYTIDQMLGHRDEELVSAADAAQLTRLKRQVLDTGVGLRAEVPLGAHYFDLTIDPICDRSGTPIGITGAAVDISERARLEAEGKQAAQTLRQSEEQLRLAQRAAGAGLWDWDMVTNAVTWSAEYYQLYGLDPSVVPSYEHWLASILPIDRARIEQATYEAIEQGKNLKVNFRIDHPEDGQRWIMVRGQTFYNQAGAPTRMTGIAINITEQKRFEEALVDSEARARRQTEELSALMAATPAAIWIAHDAHCHAMTANRMAHELMHTEPGTRATATPKENGDPLPFKQCRQGKAILPQDLPMQRAIRIRQEVTDEIEFVYPDGTVRYIYGKAVPLYGSDGAVRGAIGGFAEITALKQSEREREQLLQRERAAREEAEQANRLKDQFLAVLSHELRSPLNPILGWSKLLQTRRFDEAKTAQALATIERNAQLQAQLVDDLLDLAKILRGKLQLNPQPVTLAGVVESALETVKTTALAKGIALEVELDATVQASGDAARLQQIVANLLSNAIKFTPEGGRVTVSLGAVDDQASITVTDTGIGISADFLPYLFESFRQEDISITRRHGGLGLGLAIVRQLVELHGGTIAAHSPGEGQGATFSVRLPAFAGATVAPVVLPLVTADLTGIRVFSVDDSADTRELLTVLLGQYGAEVVTLGSAAEVLDTLKHRQPDVLISDIGMPEIDGYSLIRQIRNLPPEQGGQVPAIALTAYARDEDQQASLACGYQRHLSKPLDIEKLVQAVLELTQSPS
ncbi:MAG TPA: PAS domain-containing protein [Nodosilinea sp.]|nr:PAS domain-containing protein [Nodosilinea sp.]